MCSVKDTDEDLISKPEHLKKLPKNCVKCGEKALHVVGTNGTFCSECFKNYFTHKFRASMGKNPVVRNGDKVLIAYSGGISSAALMHLVKQGLDPEATRRLKFTAGIILVDESCVIPDQDTGKYIEEIEAEIKSSGFPYHIVKLEEVLSILPDQSNEVKEETKATEKLKELINSATSLNAKLELVYRLRCQLLSNQAQCLGYQHVFLAENSTRLAVKILSNVALGRGAHLSQDTGFSDGQRFEKCGVNLLRPLRDVSSKEIVMYNALHKVKTIFVPNLSTKKDSSSSIPNLTENFVQGLVRNFPSTEMTVYRISNKIRPPKPTQFKSKEAKELELHKCKLCLGYLDNRNEKCGANARNDLSFSQNLLNGVFGDPGSVVDAAHIEMEKNTPLSPSELQLCYSCLLVMKDVTLSREECNDIFQSLNCSTSQPCTDQQMKDKLKGLLLED